VASRHASTPQPGFLPDQSAENNRVVENELINRGERLAPRPVGAAAAA